MRHALLAALILGAVPRSGAAPDAGAVWNEVFTADEQRLLYAMRADPQADAALKAGLAKVLAAKPEALEAEKRRFQAEWLGRIQAFAKSYKPGQGQGGVKPDPAKARQQVPWLSEVDQRDWGGQLVPKLFEKMDAYELGYNVAHLRSLDEEDKKAMIGKLGWAKTFRYSADGVADEMVKVGRETMAKVLAGVTADAPGRAATARQQLEAAERMLADARRTATPGAGNTIFDGAAPRRDTSPKPPGETSVVDARPEPGAPTSPTPPAAPEGGALKPPPASSAETSAPPPGAGLDAIDVPPPKTPGKDEPTYAAKPSSSGGLGSSIAGFFKSPVGKTGAVGGLLGAIAGFFLGGPIGAVIGLVAGAALGAGAAYAAGSLAGAGKA